MFTLLAMAVGFLAIGAGAAGQVSGSAASHSKKTSNHVKASRKGGNAR